MAQKHGNVEISNMAQFFSPPQMHVLSHETLHTVYFPFPWIWAWLSNLLCQCIAAEVIVEQVQAIYIYLSAWLSPKPWLSLVSFLGDNMNHISNIFITCSSWNSFIFNCCLIFHYMGKPQIVTHFSIDGWSFLLIQKIMEKYSYACLLHTWMELPHIYILASHGLAIHTSHLLKCC